MYERKRWELRPNLDLGRCRPHSIWSRFFWSKISFSRVDNDLPPRAVLLRPCPGARSEGAAHTTSPRACAVEHSLQTGQWDTAWGCGVRGECVSIYLHMYFLYICVYYAFLCISVGKSNGLSLEISLYAKSVANSGIVINLFFSSSSFCMNFIRLFFLNRTWERKPVQFPGGCHDSEWDRAPLGLVHSRNTRERSRR